MRTLFTLSILTLFTVLSLSGQPCGTGTITFTTQQQIDDFATNYPDCEYFPYGMNFSGFDITNVNGLSQLKSINGLLYIVGTNLADLQGFENLEHIGSGVLMFNNPLIESIEQFSGITSLLTININGAPNLSSLSGLENLSSVGGQISISGTGIQNVDELALIDIIPGSLSIGANPNLTNINGLNSVTSIGANVSLGSNPLLTEVDALQALNSINGSLSIANTALTSLSGLSNITTINGGFTFIGNSISNLDDFSGLTNINGLFNLRENTNLTTLGGLSNLSNIGGGLEVVDNTSLLNLGGLEGINSLGGEVRIWNNPDLTSIDGLDNLSSIAGNLDIRDNQALLEINSLTNLNSITGYLWIQNNNSLNNLNGFANLQSIDGLMYIRDNISLVDILGFESIDAATIDLIRLSGNSSLAICEAQSICDALILQNTPSIIFGNMNQCNSVNAITSRCNGLYPIALGVEDNCTEITTLDISPTNGNNSGIINVFDNEGHILCLIDANGNSLGNTTFEMYKSSVQRYDGEGKPYIDRDITITVDNQPSSDVYLRFFYTSEEYDNIVNIDPNLGNFNGLNFTRTSHECLGVFNGGGEFLVQDESGNYGSNGDIYLDLYTDSFSSFFSHSGSSALPVNYTNLACQTLGDNIHVDFTTATEINNDKFIIEHSQDGRIFSPIGEIKGAGNSTSPINYEHIHENPTYGMNYYRIKQVDFDGRYEYSDIVSARYDGDGDIAIYPNPVRDVLHIDLSDGRDATYQIIDGMGRVVKDGVVSGSVIVEMAGMEDGVYLVLCGNLVQQIIKL